MYTAASPWGVHLSPLCIFPIGLRFFKIYISLCLCVRTYTNVCARACVRACGTKLALYAGYRQGGFWSGTHSALVAPTAEVDKYGALLA